MNNAIIENLNKLQLYGFVTALREQSESVAYHDLSFEERLAFLVEQELLRKTNARILRRLKTAQLKQSATIEQIDFKPTRGIKKHYLLDLANGNWVREHHNLIITGATGVGKSFIACALGDRFCKIGFTVRYVKTCAFIRELLIAKDNGSFNRFSASIKGVDVLILDEWMRDPITAAQAREIFDILDDRYMLASCLFVSQIPVSDWYKNFADSTLAEAILDRVVHNSLRLDLLGESMRKAVSLSVNNTSSDIKGGNVASLR